MEYHETHFKALYDEAAAKSCKLKFVAQYENGKATVGLQHIAADNDFYHLYGKDNIVLFYTLRYPQQPLVVKGAGAGADVTASGVFCRHYTGGQSLKCKPFISNEKSKKYYLLQLWQTSFAASTYLALH